MKKGTVWVYRGPAWWPRNDRNNGVTREFTWKMEVTDVQVHGGIRIARLKGHPFDLAYYEEGKKPGDYALLSVDARRFFLLSGDWMNQAWGEESEAKLRQATEKWEEAFVLEWPLLEKDAKGELRKQQFPRYRDTWYFKGVRPANLAGIAGVSPSPQAKEYELVWQGIDFYMRMVFVPEIGITHFSTAHAVLQTRTDLRLVAFHPPKD